MQKAIIIELDGVLCDNNHRKHFISGGKKDFLTYQQNLIYDEPNNWVLSIVKNLNKNIHIIFITGRNEAFRDLTIEWFRLFGIDKLDYSLNMRNDGDFRKYTEVKEEIFLYNIKNNYDIVFALDNDIEMCNIYEKNSIMTLCCG